MKKAFKTILSIIAIAILAFIFIVIVVFNAIKIKSRACMDFVRKVTSRKKKPEIKHGSEALKQFSNPDLGETFKDQNHRDYDRHFYFIQGNYDRKGTLKNHYSIGKDIWDHKQREVDYLTRKLNEKMSKYKHVSLIFANEEIQKLKKDIEELKESETPKVNKTISDLLIGVNYKDMYDVGNNSNRIIKILHIGDINVFYQIHENNTLLFEPSLHKVEFKKRYSLNNITEEK